jgi:putative FmdB family regulatory protein
MPTYDYICRACGHEFELFQQMTAPVLRKCPKCGKPRLERLIGTGAGVLFKGGGFYETDYRSDSYTKAAEAEKRSAETKPETTKTADSAKASEASKSDSKPADNGEPKATTSDSRADEGKRARRPSSAMVKPTPSRKPAAKRSKRN